jgi:hypothetical protein
MEIVCEEFLTDPVTGEAGRVYPDLIIQHLESSGLAHHLLVLEAERGTIHRGDRARDYCKLDGCFTLFGYQQAGIFEFDGRGGRLDCRGTPAARRSPALVARPSIPDDTSLPALTKPHASGCERSAHTVPHPSTGRPTSRRWGHHQHVVQGRFGIGRYSVIRQA